MASVLATIRLLTVDLLVMAGLVLIAFVVAASGWDIPESELQNLKLDWNTIVLIIAIAPAMEEMAFRSWLSGRPGFVIPVAILAVGLTGLLAVTGSSAIWVGIAIGVSALALSLWAAAKLHGHEPWRWFARHFRWFFYATSIAFAAVHLFNFESAGLAFTPLVIPQLISGAIFGFARINYGLWSAIGLHSVHNGIFIAMALLETSPST